MSENKRYSFNWMRGHPQFWDNHCDLADCYLTCEDVCELLNELDDENQKLKKENEQLKTFLEALKEELSLADRDNTTLEKENNELKTKIKKLKIENDSQSDAIEGLQETLTHLDLGDVE